ncbi:CD82 molecule a [Neoarius graeffei]|uniref:CD82 molecule a n=1 Tax=Neoarius graeffei TaxID=443677 RepID=UPI00298C7AA6|nr:CD82 molecule a [Neoarius graeffei]XP_060796777.1 CD82 molecule a [Neoarius graeffei]XP_060796778.1 CD82 molecule a [Neoarius graeffei]
MGKGCITATKYFLFLFNLLFFIFGALIMGFGLWILLDSQSFIAVLQDSSIELKVGSYIVITVGAFTMLMGFLGCLGAIYEIRCLLGLYFTLLLLLLIAQVTAAILIFLQRDVLRTTASKIVTKLVENYQGQNKSAEQAWDYVQRSMHCCGWTGPSDWQKNPVITNSSQTLYPCSCHNTSVVGENNTDGNFCMGPSSSFSDWPTYDTGCAHSVESWLFTNYGVILGICLGVAVIELLAMILSMGLCKSVHQEEYTKVPKY